MSQLVVVILAWTGALIRIYLTVTRGVTLWRSSVSAALVGCALAVSAWAYPQEFGLVPNLGSLITHVSALAGLACALVWLLSLVHVSPSARLVRSILAAGGAVCLAEILLWMIAPIHDRPSSDLGIDPRHPTLLVYFLVWYLSGIAAMVTIAAVCTFLALARTARVPTVRAGLAIIAAASLTVTMKLTLLAIYATHAQLWGDEDSTFKSLGNGALSLAMLGFPLGICCVLLGEAVTSRFTERSRRRLLQPLHTALTARYPHMVLPEVPARFRAARMGFEVLDALDALPVEARREVDPYWHVVHTVLHPPTVTRGVSALRYLTVTAPERSDDERLVQLATIYRDAVRESTRVQ